MRLLPFAFILAACGGGGTDPRVIPGGGIGDGDIDGKVFVHVIDNSTDAPLANASVAIGGMTLMTDAKGFVELGDVDGPQTIAVKLQGYRSTVWAMANGKNVTIPLDKTTTTVGQATLSGSITGWDPSGLGAGHVKAAAVLYSQTDNLGDEANQIDTPNDMNICGGLACNFTVNTRTGTVSLIAAILDVDGKGTTTQADDTFSIIGWATKTGITVEGGVNQSGLALTIVEAGNIEAITVDYGTPPAALTMKSAFVGIEIGDDEVVQLPFLDQTSNMLLAPKPAVFGGTRGMRLTAIAQTNTGGLGAQSIVIRHDLSGPTLAAGTWLTPPVGVSATRSSATWGLVTGAVAHQVQFVDAAGVNQLQITVFDNKTTTIDVPALVSLPVSGNLTARVAGIGADFDVEDFSLEDDEDKLFALAAQPAAIP